MRLQVHGTATTGRTRAARPGGNSAADVPGCPSSFADRYTAAYRTAYRLLGDPDRSVRIAREAVAAAEAAVVPRSERVRSLRACRTAGMTALRETKDEIPAIGDERARLRAALRSLPAQPRAVFLLVRVAGLAASDVGAVLGLSPEWCGSQLRVAERSVRELVGVTIGHPRPVPADASVPEEPNGPSRGRRAMLLAARGER